MLTKERLQQMNEAELRKEVLIPLLRTMGYRDVFEYHGGAAEQGKDIVCWKVNDLGNRTNLALVVKAEPITGKAAIAKATAGEVQMQIHQCFGKPFLDSTTAEERFVHQCWLVSSKTISKEAEDAIKSALTPTRLDRDVNFVNGDKLWELIEKHLPIQAVWQKLDEAKKVFDNWDSHYQPQVKIGNSGIEVRLHEKFPGALEEKPFEINSTFNFPDTPEGQTAKKALERSFATGAPAEIPAPFIKSVEFPESFKQLFGTGDFKIESFSVGPAEGQQPLLTRIEIQCNDNDSFVLEHIHFKIVQGGTEEITLANNEQPSPVQIRLTLHLRDGRGTAKFDIKQDPLNVKQLLEILRLRTCLSKPSVVRIVHLDTGIPIFELRQNVGIGEAPDIRWVNTIKDLLAIQIKVKRPIIVPARELTSEEIETIISLRTILNEGKITAQWSRFSMSLTPEGVRNVLDVFGDGKSNRTMVEVKEFANLFDVQLPLGTVRIICNSAKLVNEPEVREKLDSVADQETAISCKFVPASDETFTKEYFDWSPIHEQNQKRNSGSVKRKKHRRKAK